MPKVLYLSCILIFLVCGCKAPQNLRTTMLAEGQFIEGKTIIPNEKITREYQPSGSSNYTGTAIESQKKSVETNTSNFDTESLSSPTSDNFITEKNILVEADTVVVKSIEMTELKEANQSFTYGLISFIALMAAALIAIAPLFLIAFGLLILIAEMSFLSVSLVFGILGLRKGIIAKRIIAQNKGLYSNTKKATWGIILSLAHFSIIIMIMIALLVILFTGSLFEY